nr:MAG TPA: hypothetical protein [Caudoviricetes sp.]
MRNININTKYHTKISNNNYHINFINITSVIYVRYVYQLNMASTL